VLVSAGMCLPSLCVTMGLCVTIYLNLNCPMCMHLDSGRDFNVIRTTSQICVLFSDVIGEIQTEGVCEQGVEVNIWTEER
jgi:hypothetical protein